MTRHTPRRTKRIVMWLPGLSEHGGIARHNRLLCRAVSQYAYRNGASVHIVSLRDDDQYFDSEFVTEPVVGCEGRRGKFALSAITSLRERVDLLVVGVVDFGPLVPATRLLCRSTPILTITHGIEVWKPLRWPTRVALARAASIMSVSAYTAGVVARLHGVSRDLIHVVAPPLDPGFLSAAEERMPRPVEPASSRLLTVSRLNRIDAPKGVERVIEALPIIRTRVPDVRYTVLGTGDDQERLEALAERLGVGAITQFEGAVNDEELHARLADTDLFVLPSSKEGFGIVFLEAGIYGKAVVGGDFGGIPEVVIDGVTGVLVDPGDALGLANVVSELLLDDALRTQLGRHGSERVRDTYSYELFEDGVADVLDPLLHFSPAQRNPAPITR